MSERKSNDVTVPYSYRLTAHDRTVLETEHGTLANFFNERVKAEVKRIEKKSKSAKSKVKLKT